MVYVMLRDYTGSVARLLRSACRQDYCFYFLLDSPAHKGGLMRMFRHLHLQRLGVFLAAICGFAVLDCASRAHADDATSTFVGVLAIANDESVAKQIGLSDDVRAKLASLIEKREQDATELAMQSASMSADEKAAKLKAFRVESEKQGLALLSEDQRKQLDRIKLQKTGLASLADGALAEQVKLTAEQQAEIAKLIVERDSTIAKANPAQRKMYPGYYEKKIGDVITKDQRAQWEQIAGGPSEIGDSASPAPGGSAGGARVAVAPSAAASKGDPKANKDTAIERTVDGKLKFNFRYQPWKDVLDWFAQKADLSLVMDIVPPGTFNYSDDKAYTPAEAIDILNGVLLTRDFTLVRRDRMLMVVSLRDGIPPNTVPTVGLDDLPNRGKFELVTVVFPLSKLSPDEASTLMNSLKGPQGSVVSLAQARQMLVTDTAGRLLTIKQILDRTEGPAGRDDLRHFNPQFASAHEMLGIVKQLLGIASDKVANDAGTLRLLLDGNQILASGRPDQVDRVAEIIKMLDVPGRSGFSGVNEQPQLEVYPITGADPTSVLQVMQTLLAGLPDVRLTIDPQTGFLVALARPSQHATIRATLDQMQRDGRRIEVIQLRAVDPQTAVLAINKLFGGDEKNPGPNAPKVDAEPTLRRLLVRGTEGQVSQIKAMVTKLEGPESGIDGATDRGTLRFIPLTGRQGRSALEQLQQLWPATHQNSIRVITPSGGFPEIRPAQARGPIRCSFPMVPA